MTKRETISKKIRFEVFKRDNFTCQYCGRMAPDVVLEIDHINPIDNGGDNDIMNLITSCFECNRGKGKRKLSVNTELKKQQEQLKFLNKKRQQFEMMLEWKKELSKFEDEQVNKIVEIFLNKTNHEFNEIGKMLCKRWIKKYSFEEVYEATISSIEQYYDLNDTNSLDKTFNYIERICINRKKQKDDPNLKDINYLVKIAKNMYNITNYTEQKIKVYLSKKYQKNDFDNIKFIIINANRPGYIIDDLIYYYEGTENGN